MNYIYAIIFGIVEGITEWLPISSTGHLILLRQFIDFSNVPNGFFDMFEVVIQLGAILAVVLVFIKELWPFSLKEKAFIKKDTFMMWFKILVACIPAAVIGLLFEDIIEKLFYNPVCISCALIVVGIFFIICETLVKDKDFKVKSIDKITFKDAFAIGLFQVIAAIFPGTSRSGITILGGLSIGLSRETISKFTFFLAVPVMFGASLLKGVKYVLDPSIIITNEQLYILLISCASAFIISLFVINFLLDYIRKHDFKPFGYYRIFIGIIFLIYFLFFGRF